MKQFFKSSLIAIVAIMAFAFTSCETIDPGHKGVEVSWGGETNLIKVYPEGITNGFHWLWDDIIQYDVRETTLVETFEFNDKNNMLTKVELSLDYRLNPNKVNILHSTITDVETKIIKTLKSAGKEVVPQYSAVELNISKRVPAEEALATIIREELPEFYVEFRRIQMTDVDIPPQVAKLAEETAVQLGRNELALKKEAEQIALANANVAKAEGDYRVAEYEAKAKELLSRPAVLRFYEAETDRIWAKKGVSPYGNNNVFGGEAGILKMKN